MLTMHVQKLPFVWQRGYVLLVFLFVWTLLTAGFAPERDDDEEDCRTREKRSLICIFGLTGLMKEMLYNALLEIRQNDPMELGDVPDSMLSDGVLRGLSTLTNVTGIDVHCDGDLVIFGDTLGMQNAEVRYKWHHKFLFTFSGTIWMRAEEVNFAVEVSLNATQEQRFVVTNSLLTKLENFEFGFTGLGPVNPLVKGLVKIIHKVWSKRVMRTLEKLLRRALERQLRNFSLLIA